MEERKQPDYLQPTGVEVPPVIPPELTKTGVAPVVPLTLTKEAQAAGIKPVGAEIPVSLQPEGITSLSSEEKARSLLSVFKNFFDSGRWLANFIRRQLKKEQLQRQAYAG